MLPQPAPSTRERIVQAALDLFWRKGYAGASMADILNQAGVNSGSFYYFFKSKEDLLLAVLDRYKQMLRPVLLAPIWEATPDPIGRIFGLLERYRELILATGCTYGCPIGRLALEIDPQQRAVHEKIAENFAGWAAAVEECLREARDRLPAGLDLRRLSSFILTVMEGGVMQSRSYASVAPFDMAVAQLRDYFDRLRERKPPRRKRRNA